MDMNNELIDERATSPVGQSFRVCASKTEAEALELTKTNPNILYFSSDTNTIIFNGDMRTNPTPDLRSVLKKTDIIDNTSTNDNTKVLSAKQGKLLNDTKLNKTDVIGNLTNTDDTKALAASQGKILNDKKIDKTAIENTVNSSDVNKVLSAAMGKFLNDNKVSKSEIVDDTSTDDATKPLSARQGKSLQDEITVLENNIQDLQTSIPTKVSQLTNDSNYLTSARVLTKDNTDTYSPTENYHPATKKYVENNVIKYYKINNDKFLSYLRTPVIYKDGDAENAITFVFNTIDNFKQFIDNALDNKYILVFLNGSNNEKINISNYHVYRSSNGNYELSFIFIYSENTDSDAFELVTTRVFISYNASNGYKFIVQNLVQSDNLTTVTKKTKSEYDGIATKDNSTMYAVTE